MAEIAVKDVCRLCLKTDDLVWVFDKRFQMQSKDSLTDVIHITTGVEVLSKDIISQKICIKCRQITVKMFEFRNTSLKNDKYLREQCHTLLKNKEMKIPNTQVTIKSDKKKPVIPDKKMDTNQNEFDVKSRAKRLKVHPSVRQLFKTYPKIKLPSKCLKYDITPCVSMKMDQVETYFKSRNVNFQECTKLALKLGRVATKKTKASVIGAKGVQTARKHTVAPKLFEKTGENINTLNTRTIDTISLTNISLISSQSNSLRDEIKNLNDNSAPLYISSEVQISVSKKRKFSEIDADEKECKKTNFVQSLGLTPNFSPVQNLLEKTYVTNHSVPVHICEICNSVQYSANNLRRHHHNMHLRCQFCKIRIRSLELKHKHLNNECPVKNIMNNLPVVQMPKVELNVSIRNIYSKAFKDFPPLENRSIAGSCLNVIKAEPARAIDDIGLRVDCSPVLSRPQIVTKGVPNIIEIISDEETSNNKLISTQAAPAIDSNLPQPENIVYNSVSIVRPNIRIKGSQALNYVNSNTDDMKMLKHLLTVYRPVHLITDKNVQTEIPSSSTIFVNGVNMTAHLRLFKSQLFIYKVPVVIKSSTFFHVNYNSTGKQTQIRKKLQLWNDLTPVDIQPSNARAKTPSQSDKSKTVTNTPPRKSDQCGKFKPVTNTFSRTLGQSGKPKAVLNTVPRTSDQGGKSKAVTTTVPRTSDVGMKSKAVTNTMSRTLDQSVKSKAVTDNSNAVLKTTGQPITPTTTKFIRVNASSLCPITTSLLTSPPSNLVSANAKLNSVLQSTSPVAVINMASNAESQPQVDIIRIKNVCDLTGN
ncbi:hypothetical protein NQ315_007295 [Exocentrus adspersus]|uniref:ZAD domain-containing protein n=1 Tax=Exocentrus adspersus TaxID=1586481 RepID=A0AAV8WDT7_9CUCU|nr:hypothetical protein NQ315_007295 [Exocentrus adspersus]